MRQALSDLRVVELSDGVAGAYCAKLLADFGADVIKAEPPEGDPARRDGPFPRGERDEEASGLFIHLNTNKRSIVADPANDEGRELLARLLEGADVFVESMRPGALDAWGLGWESLHERHPGLVVVSVTPFGQDGPYAQYRGEEIVTFAMGGAMNVTGTPDREPLKLPGNVQQYYAGNVAAVAALAGVVLADASGEGSHLDVSVTETLAASVDRRTTLLLGYQYRGVTAERMHVSVGALPLGVFPCSDGYVTFQTLLPHMQRMLDAMGSDRLREVFSDPAAITTVEAREAVEEELYPWLLERTRAEITGVAQAHGWPGVGLNTPRDVVEADHLHQRGFWVSVEHPEAGAIDLPASPIRFAEGGWRLRRRAPGLGEHGAEIEAELSEPRPERSVRGRQDGWGPGRLPLDGIRVADLSIVWAGPFVTQFLADLGAEVIRVENPYVFPPSTKGLTPRPSPEIRDTLGPLASAYGPLVPGMPDRPYNRHAMHNAVNRNKRSFTVDTRRPEGRDVVLRLIETCDVVVENFAAETLPKIGFHPSELLLRNPRLILLRLPPAGLSGEWAYYTGFGQQFESLAGLMYLWGYADSDPTTNVVTAYMDAATGPAGAFALLAALRYREATGRGQVVELSQTENLVHHVGEILLDYQMTGTNQRTLGNRHPRRAPQGVYACRGHERWLTISVGDDEEWAAMTRVMGAPDLADDDRFATAEARLAHHDELDDLVAAWAREQDVTEAFHALQQAGATAGLVLDEEMAYADAHLEARGFFRPLTSRDVGAHLHPGHLFRGVPQAWWRGAPALGEDNEYVYKKVLGIDDAEYERLASEGHIVEDYLDPEGNPL